jgi:hypothetical protein
VVDALELGLLHSGDRQQLLLEAFGFSGELQHEVFEELDSVRDAAVLV